MPDVEWNRRVWNEKHPWDYDGDEWSGMARFCRQPYEDWKAALVEEFLTPRLSTTADVLEVAPGHGRFSEYITARARTTTLVDLSPTCLDKCRQRFGERPEIRYILTDGRSLPGVEDGTIDFIWSFDSFVHMEAPVISAYLNEFARVLRPRGIFTIHHAAKRAWSLRLVPMTSRLGRPGRVAQRLASQGRLRDEGSRANVSRESVATMTRDRGMTVVAQRDCWGPNGEYNVRKFGDCITTGERSADDYS